MIIEKLELKNFRKFKDTTFAFTSGLNLITGPNGSGKSTIIQAISYAIYGETVFGRERGFALRDNLRYGLNGRSYSGYVGLSVSNSKRIKISREISLKENVATQETVLNGKKILISNISILEKSFPSKDLFDEFISIDSFRHDLADLNQIEFRQMLSNHLLKLDMQRVLDNAKSFATYLRSKETVLLELAAENERKICELEKNKKKTIDLEQARKNLSERLEAIQCNIKQLEESKFSKEVHEKEIFDLLKNKERDLEQISIIASKLKKDWQLDENFYKELMGNEALNRHLQEYADKTTLIYKVTQDTKEILFKIFGIQQNIHEELEKTRKEISYKLSVEHEKAALTIAKLEQVAQEIASNELVSKEREKIDSLSLGYKNDLDKCRVEAKIAENLKNLMISAWKSTTSSFLAKIGQRVTDYLERINTGMYLKITEDEIRVGFKGGEVDIYALSAGESVILNLLIRIAVLQELGQKSFLILDDPIMYFDEERTSKFISLLNLIKNDFSQIIITTHRENLPFETDNNITL